VVLLAGEVLDAKPFVTVTHWGMGQPVIMTVPLAALGYDCGVCRWGMERRRWSSWQSSGGQFLCVRDCLL